MATPTEGPKRGGLGVPLPGMATGILSEDARKDLISARQAFATPTNQAGSLTEGVTWLRDGVNALFKRLGIKFELGQNLQNLQGSDPFERVSSLVDRVEKLEGKSRESTNDNSFVTHLKGRVDVLEKWRQGDSSVRDRFMQDANAIRQEVTQHTKEVNTKWTQAEKLVNQLSDRVQALEQANSENKAGKELADLRSQLTTLQSELTKLNNQVNQNAAKNNAAVDKSELDGVNKQLKALSDSLNALQQKVAQPQNTNILSLTVPLQREIDTLKDQVKTLMGAEVYDYKARTGVDELKKFLGYHQPRKDVPGSFNGSPEFKTLVEKYSDENSADLGPINSRLSSLERSVGQLEGASHVDSGARSRLGEIEGALQLMPGQFGSKSYFKRLSDNEEKLKKLEAKDCLDDSKVQKLNQLVESQGRLISILEGRLAALEKPEVKAKPTVYSTCCKVGSFAVAALVLVTGIAIANSPGLLGQFGFDKA